MSFNTLLLGSAAVIVAVSGARASDAIVAEPEPVEYVRVCDAYGVGWWYIPGTETCLKLEGEVRVQYDVTHYHDKRDDETSSHDADYRAQLDVRASSETEYGTLASRFRLQANGGADSETGIGGGHHDTISISEGPFDANAVVNVATISLAGFEFGFGDSYWNRAGGFGYYNARFGGFSDYKSGLYLDYTYAANGFTATVGIEDGTYTGEAGAPDIYGGLTYTGGGWYLAAVAYYDSTVGSGAYRLRAEYDMSSIVPGLAVGGWYSWDNGDTEYVKGHVWGVTAKVNLFDNLVLFGGYSDYADQYEDDGITPACVYCTLDYGNNSATDWTVGLSWNPVPGLLIQPEYHAITNEDETVAGANYGQFSLRIIRTF